MYAACSRSSAHPHVCGEHWDVAIRWLSAFGSSPRVWGAQQHPRARKNRCRLIPTCVGSTDEAKSAPSSPTAHPHVCGEHVSAAFAVRDTRGSSPRVWGAQGKDDESMADARLIPTCVGSTVNTIPGFCAIAAHPHVCGEHLVVMPLLVAYGGSSPRVWGAPRRPLYRSLTGRLIPTCVGSTLGWCSSLPAAPAHPHVCGEHISPFAAHGSAVGSSPRVWGAPHLRFRLGAARRLIPTCVGSTHPE